MYNVDVIRIKDNGSKIIKVNLFTMTLYAVYLYKKVMFLFKLIFFKFCISKKLT